MKEQNEADKEGASTGVVLERIVVQRGYDFVFASHDTLPVGVAAKRNNRATAQRRRNKILSAAVSEVLHGKGRSKKDKVKAGSALSQSFKRGGDE